MRVYSWNLWFSNSRLDDAFAFIRDADFDIFCLQEVPEPFLERLKELPFERAYAPEIDRLFRGAVTTQYLVILSRFPIHASKPIPLALHEPFVPRRGNLFAKAMRALGLWGWGQGNRHALVADLETPAGRVRVLNLHLPLIAPLARQEELNLLMRNVGHELPTIVCGDCNVIESPHMAALNWLFGMRARDAARWKQERLAIERIFAQYDLANPLRGRSTHPLSQSQLDHILLPRHFSVRGVSVLSDRHGSDHHPVCVEVDEGVGA